MIMLKRIITISIAVVFTLMLGACSGDFDDTTEKDTDTKETMNKEQTITYRPISMDEAVIMMQNESNYIILDVRRPDEFAAGHIPNAVNVPNESIGTSDIPELPDKDQLIMVYCRSGRRSKEASEKLVKLGYTNIVEFGGILDWTGEIVSGTE